MLAVASDHAGKPLKDIILKHLESQNIAFIDYGYHDDSETTDYPIYALRVANAIKRGECKLGLLFCGTGIGMSLAANKVSGIRCAVCSEPYSALMSREHNDANILALGSRVVGPELAKMIIDVWLSGTFSESIHSKRLKMISEIEATGTLEDEKIQNE